MLLVPEHQLQVLPLQEESMHLLPLADSATDSIPSAPTIMRVDVSKYKATRAVGSVGRSRPSRHASPALAVGHPRHGAFCNSQFQRAETKLAQYSRRRAAAQMVLRHARAPFDVCSFRTSPLSLRGYLICPAFLYTRPLLYEINFGPRNCPELSGTTQPLV